MYVCMCSSVFVCVSMCVCMYLHVLVCVPICMYVFIYIHMCECASMCMCVYVDRSINQSYLIHHFLTHQFGTQPPNPTQ